MILSPQEKIRDLTTRGWWGHETLDDLFRRAVAAVPQREAVVDAPNRPTFTDGKACRLAFAELDGFVNAVADQLLRSGVGKDDVVAMQLPNIVEAAAVLLACVRIGAVLSPIAVQYRENELEHIFRVLKPRAFVTITNVGGHNPARLVARMRIPSLTAILAWGTDSPEGVISLEGLTPSRAADANVAAHLAGHPLDANDVVTICWTSGTESRPKGVPRSHNHWIAIGKVVATTVGVQEGYRILNPFPMVNMASIGGVFLPWLLYRGTMVLHQPFHLPTFLQQTAAERINYNLAPPAVLNMLLKQSALWADLDFSNLRAVGSGSAPLAPWMMKSWQEDHGINVVNLFGSNEGCALVSSAVDVPDPEHRAHFFPRFGVDGFTWACSDVLTLETRLVDPATERDVTEPGVQGELRLRGATVFDGYYGDDDLNRTAFDAEGFFRTGDLFTIAGDGDRPRFYHFVGRLKEIIIRGGQNISPAEIDGLIDGHPKIAEAAVVGVPDEIMGERVCAVVVPRPGETVTLDDITSHLRQRHVAIYKWPERVVSVPALPRNQLGKVVRSSLREMVAQVPA